MNSETDLYPIVLQDSINPKKTSRKRSAALHSFENDNVKRATVMIGVNVYDNVVTILSKKSTPFTDPDRKDYRGPVRIISQLDKIQEMTTDYISTCQLNEYRSICDADPETGRPRMWGCEHCNWLHLQEKKEMVTYLEQPPVPPIQPCYKECKCYWARHMLHETVYQRNHRNRQAMLQSCRNILNNQNLNKPCRGVYTPHPKAALDMLQGADLEGGEVYTTIYSALNELTWCPCITYARDLRDIVLDHLTPNHLGGINQLGLTVMSYLLPFTPLPKGMAFSKCNHGRHDIEHDHNNSGEEDSAYFIDVKWIEN